MLKQYVALMGTEEVQLVFEDAAIQEIASLAADINSSVENIGARRLQTVLEKLLEDISFDASDKPGSEHVVTADMVREKVGTLAKDTDLSRFIL